MYQANNSSNGGKNGGGGRQIRIDEGSIRKGGINQTPPTPRPNVTPPPSKPTEKK